MAEVGAIKVAKYSRLVEQLRGKISSGELRPGDRLPSFAEFRTQFGATIATVERVLSELEKDGLVVREHGRGIFVAQPAIQKAHAIGVLSGSFGWHAHLPYFTQLVKGVQEVAVRHDMHVTLLEGSLPNIQWSLIDGVLLLEGHPKTFEARYNRLPPGMKSVSILSISERIPSVVADDFGGARDLTRHLLSLGHRRIGYLLGSSQPVLEQRIAGYSTALQESAIALDRELIHLHHDEASRDFTEHGLWAAQKWPHLDWQNVRDGRCAMKQWLDSGWRDLGCTALLAQNDVFAIGAIEALRQAGYDVPGQVSVAGFDGTDVGAYASTRLTTVEVPLRDIGVRSAELLMSHMTQDEKSRETIVLPAQVRVGGSSAPAHSGQLDRPVLAHNSSQSDNGGQHGK